MDRRFYAVLAPALARCTLPGWAQRTVPTPNVPTLIRGTVRDATSQQPIPYCQIVLDSDQRGYLQQQNSDPSGKFSFTGIGHDVFILRAKQPGYLEVSRRVDLSLSTSDYVNFELKPDPKSSIQTVIPPEGPGASISAIPAEAKVEFDKGKKLLADNKLSASIPHLKKAVSVHPGYLDAHLALGVAYLDQGNFPDAREHLERCIQINDRLPGAHLALGTLFNHMKNFAAAEKPLRRGLELAPESAEGHFELARTYMAMGRWSEAETHASLAVSLRSDEPVVHVALGNILLRKNDQRSALVQFKEYLRLAPRGAMADQARLVVARLEQATEQH